MFDRAVELFVSFGWIIVEIFAKIFHFDTSKILRGGVGE